MSLAVNANSVFEKRDIYSRCRDIVEGITDQNVLAGIATGHNKDPDWKIRIAAINEITDQGVLERIVIGDDKDPDWTVRYIAVKRLENKSVLKDVSIRSERCFNKR